MAANLQWIADGWFDRIVAGLIAFAVYDCIFDPVERVETERRVVM